VAAVNRAQATLVNYPKTPANEDALVLLVEGYDKLGMIELRDDTRRVLKETFPNGRYFAAGATKPWWKFGAGGTAAAGAEPTPKAWWQLW
jgi:outer membrane protein assembly factor BamD